MFEQLDFEDPLAHTGPFWCCPRGLWGQAKRCPCNNVDACTTIRPLLACYTTNLHTDSCWSLSKVPPDEGLPGDAIHPLWIDMDGDPWVASDDGVFVHSDEGCHQLLDEPVERIQGVDAQERVWAILEEEKAIAAYDSSEAWSFYGPAQGWVVPPVLAENVHLSGSFWK